MSEKRNPQYRTHAEMSPSVTPLWRDYLLGKSRATVVFALSLCAVGSAAYADSFECAFIQEKYLSGRPNQASCSMLPEKAYSTRAHTPRSNEHCKIESIYSFEDLIDVEVDTGQKIVSWTRHYGLTDEAKPKQKAYLLKEGTDEREAEKRINTESKRKEVYRIVNQHVSSTRIYRDEVTGKLNDPPKTVPEYNFMIASSLRTYYLYVPEASGHAILFEPTGMGDASWVNLRFGKCRKVK